MVPALLQAAFPLAQACQAVKGLSVLCVPSALRCSIVCALPCALPRWLRALSRCVCEGPMRVTGLPWPVEALGKGTGHDESYPTWCLPY